MWAVGRKAPGLTRQTLYRQGPVAYASRLTTAQTQFRDKPLVSVTHMKRSRTKAAAGRRGHRKLIFEVLGKREVLAGYVDPFFGNAGELTPPTALEFRPALYAGDLVTDAQGRLVAASTQETGRGRSIRLSRFLPNGELDLTFGNGGVAAFAIADGSEQVIDVAIQSNGRMVVLSEFRRSDNNSSISAALTGITADGEIDLTFAQQGTVDVLFDPIGHTQPRAIIAGPNDELFVLATNSGPSTLLMKFSEEGDLDLSFGDDGFLDVRTASADNAYAQDLIQLQDGSLIFASQSDVNGLQNAYLFKSLPNGELDPTFGDAGRIVIEDLASSPRSKSIRLVADDTGGFYVGAIKPGAQLDDRFFLARYNSDGQPTLSFGVNGVKLINEASSLIHSLNDLELTIDGDIFLSGITREYFINEFHPINVRVSSNGEVNAVTEYQSVYSPRKSFVRSGGLTSRLADGSFVTIFDDLNLQQPFLLGFETDGTINQGFASGARVTLPPTQKSSAADGLELVELPNGQLLALTYETEYEDFHAVAKPFLSRYSRDGLLDPTYGDGGLLELPDQTLDIPGQPTFRGFAELIERQGNYYVVVRNGLKIKIGSLDSQGNLQPEFGEQGWLTWDYEPFMFTGSTEASDGDQRVTFQSVVPTEDGFLVSLQYTVLSTRFNEYRLHKIDFSGNASLDFAGGLFVRLPTFFSTSGSGSQIELGADNSIFLYVANVGSVLNFDTYVYKYNAQGSLKTDFAEQGILNVGIGTGRNLDDQRRLRVQSDGKLLILSATRLGIRSGALVLARFNSDGDIDLTFGPDGTGRFQVDPSSMSEEPSDLIIDDQGRYLVAATASDFFQTDSLIYRFDQNGLLDQSFGTQGVKELRLSPFVDQLNSLSLNSAGDILAFGVRETDVDRQAIAIRLPESTAPHWQNRQLFADVTNDDVVSALDALVIINYLFRSPGGSLPEDRMLGSNLPYYDVNGDGVASALDALLVINRIGSASGADSEQFGESVKQATNALVAGKENTLFDQRLIDDVIGSLF